MAIRGSESLGPDVRQLHALLSSHRIGPRYCERPGCFTATREGKPFCSDHVEDHPRVRRLLATIRQREREVQAIARRGSNAVRSDHLIVAEVVTHLRATGQQTLERLAKDTGLPFVVVRSIARWLRRRRIGAIGLTKRGSTTLRLAS